jgi:dTDP-4-dehydrorhamnose 3,5-epimerase-like enzyme
MRGQVTEVFRREWGDTDPAQWSLLHSDAEVLRGMHLSLKRDRYYVPRRGT